LKLLERSVLQENLLVFRHLFREGFLIHLDHINQLDLVGSPYTGMLSFNIEKRDGCPLFVSGVFL
jgi:hypothetical protein